MAYILSLDQGTTSSRAIVFDGTGAVRALAQREFTQHYPRSGWVEHDPAEIWSSQLAVAHEALAEAGIGGGDLDAIAIANQRETTIAWDRRTGEPACNAIVWQDRRTARAAQRLRDSDAGALVRQRTGLVPDSYFSALKMRWILDNADGARALAERGRLAFGTVDAWLIWNLTRGERFVTDATNASRSMLLDLSACAWDDELLEATGVPRAALPEVVTSSGVIGETAPDLFGAGVPIAGVAGDQQAALFGQGCYTTGRAKCTYGTGSFVLVNAGETVPAPIDGILSTLAWSLYRGPSYALEGSVFVSGAAVQWLRDGLGLIEHSSDVEALAGRVDDSGGVVFVPALTGLGAPFWDEGARGTILGITRGTTGAHLARATLDAIAMRIADVVKAMDASLDAPIAELRVDGGGSANDLLMQMQADAIGRPVLRARTKESTALGAALLAGLGVGVWESVDALGALWSSDTRFEPGPMRAQMVAVRERWRDAVERAKGWE